MAYAHLTRKASFSAAHRYYKPDWSPEENARVFGACANPHGHGHNYEIEVTVASEIDAVTGFSANLPELDRLIATHVTDALDHQHLNYAIADFAEGKLIPTSENIAAWCWGRLAGALPASMVLKRIRLHEDRTFYVDYFG